MKVKTVLRKANEKYGSIACKAKDAVKRQYCAELTRDMLVQWGFIEPHWTSDGWKIFRYWYGSGKHITKTIKEINITEARGKHKYTEDKIYLKLTFSYNKKGISVPLSRFIYAWFYGKVPAGMDVEHISNNPYDNSLSNLRLCTREENLAKRFMDNPEANCNQ